MKFSAEFTTLSLYHCDIIFFFHQEDNQMTEQSKYQCKYTKHEILKLKICLVLNVRSNDISIVNGSSYI